MGFVHCAGGGNWALGTGFGTDGTGVVCCDGGRWLRGGETANEIW